MEEKDKPEKSSNIPKKDLDVSEEEVIENWQPNKKELSDELKKAILSNELKEDVLEGIIKEEKIVLSKLESENSKLKYTGLSDYMTPDKRRDYESKQRETEREYDDNSTRVTQVKVETPKEKEKAKEEFKFIKFKSSY